MWDWLKDASKKLVETGAAYMQHRAFILSLFNMPQQQAYWALKQRIDEMDEASIQAFSGTLAGMIGEAQQAIQQSSDNSAWGDSYEDRLALGVARIQTGSYSSGNPQAQMYLQGLNAVAQYGTQFYQEKLARAAQTRQADFPFSVSPQGHINFPAPSPGAPNEISAPPPAAPPVESPAAVDTSQIESMLEKLVKTGELDPNMMQQISALNDPEAMDRLMAKLQEMGVDVESSSGEKIEDFYRPRNIKYELKWPLAPARRALPIPFDELDEPTQFSVLFGEWTARHFEGNQALYLGQAAIAETIYEECLARAEQLDVAELKARSFEGLMSVAQKRGDRQAERKWIEAAMAARANA